MKQKIKSRGLILGRPKGGTIKCADCQRLLGYLHEEHLDYAYVHLICHCGASGSLEIGKRKEQAVTALAEVANEALTCPECKNAWFDEAEGARAFAFRFGCNCGTVAENRHESVRKVYVELNFSEL